MRFLSCCSGFFLCCIYLLGSILTMGGFAATSLFFYPMEKLERWRYNENGEITVVFEGANE